MWSIPPSLYNQLLSTPSSEEKAIEIQIRARNWVHHHGFTNEGFTTSSPNYIAAVDISYEPVKNPDYGIACAVLWDWNTSKMIGVKYFRSKIKFPYISGLLAFREVPLLVQALDKLQQKPDLIITDGHGIMHPRHFGEAVHLSLVQGIPTMGVAKNPFFGIGNWKTAPRKYGTSTYLYPPSNPQNLSLKEILPIGAAVCLHDEYKPIFVSPGIGISLKNAISICLQLAGPHRLPEPSYLADNLSRQKVQE